MPEKVRHQYLSDVAAGVMLTPEGLFHLSPSGLGSRPLSRRFDYDIENPDSAKVHPPFNVMDDEAWYAPNFDIVWRFGSSRR